jgi:hypothetical protein
MRTEHVKDAEFALLEVEKQALDAGISLKVAGDHNLVKEHEDAIAHENEASQRTLNCARVDEWMEDEMDAVSFVSTIADEKETSDAGPNVVAQSPRRKGDQLRKGDNVVSVFVS